MTWRSGPEDAGDARNTSDWERAAYERAEQLALTRRKLLQMAGIGAGATMLAPLAAARAGTAAAAGSLVIARGQASDSLDPHKSSLLVAHEVMWQIYDSLIYLDEKGKVYPGLATAWKFAPNHLTLTFKLRRGVKFHDGTPFDGNAVKFTVDRHMAKATASPTTFLLGPLKGVTVIDPYTVAYHYSAPFVPVFVGLSYSYMAPISPAAVKKYGQQFGRNPVGTGAYKFVAWTADDAIKLTRNPDHNWSTPFYRDPAGKPLTRGPVVDDVEFRVIPEDATRISSLISKEVDVIAGTNAVPDDRVASLRKTSGIEVVQRPAVGVYYANLNTQKPPLDDVRVRQAINYAVDKEKLVQLAIGGQGVPAKSIVASGFADYNPHVKDYKYDPEKAKSLLKAAGQAKGFSMDYIIIKGSEFDRAAQVVQQDLSKVGIKVKITSLPVGQMIVTTSKQKPQMAFFYYTYSDPDVVVQILAPGSPFAWSYQNDPPLAKWLEQQRVVFNKAQRRQLLWKIQARAADQAYYLMLWEGRYSVAARNDVKNIHIDLVGFIHAQEMEKA